MGNWIAATKTVVAMALGAVAMVAIAMTVVVMMKVS